MEFLAHKRRRQFDGQSLERYITLVMSILICIGVIIVH
jgi:hypothetical protein